MLVAAEAHRNYVRQMYTAISLKRLLVFLAWPFGMVLVAYLLFAGLPGDLSSAVRTIGSAITIWTILLVAVFGPIDKRWSIWRWIWRRVPALNRAAFPDLNGVWQGKTYSNWNSILKMLNAAEASGGLDRESLAHEPLKEDGITMTIRASLFAFRISAKVDATEGSSHSLTERISEDKRKGQIELYYVYRQETPQPELTDDDSHLGAACLTIDLKTSSMSGAYWTKRSWRSGFNTAGRIDVQRISD